MFQVQSGLDFVADKLASHCDINPQDLLHLASRYGLPGLVERPFRQLLDQPLHSITIDAARSIGLDAYFELVTTKSTLEKELRDLAYQPADLIDFFCLIREECLAAWEQGWWTCVAKPLLHPDNPKAIKDVLSELEYLVGIPGMCEDCSTRTLEAVVKDAENMSKMLEDVIMKGVNSLQARVTPESESADS